MLTRRSLLASGAALLAARMARAETPWIDPLDSLVAAARTQIGVTLHYDPVYAAIAYPKGDVPRDRGVCTDVVIRAYRDALAIDLQRLVHEDMAAHFSKYPQSWGLSRPDSHIDHRRVGNLRAFLARREAALDLVPGSFPMQRGDVVTMIVPLHLAHIAIVSDRRSADGARPLIIHNIGQGTREEDRLGEFGLTGWYRWTG